MGLTKTEVSELYVSIFNRASEKAGNEGWQTQDMTLSQMATEMLDTTASSEYFGDSLNSNLEFIKHIYKNTLNKVYEDDKIGIDGWASQLDAGVMSRGEVVADIVEVIKDYKEGGAKYETADYKTKQAAKQFINRVEVSDYVAENVTYIAKDAQEIESLINSLSFTEDGLSVTDDILTVNSAINTVQKLYLPDEYITTLSNQNYGLSTLSDSSTDGVLALDSGTYWEEDLKIITYSLNQTIPSDYYRYPNNELTTGWKPLDSDYVERVDSVMQKINSLLDLDMQKVDDNGLIRFNLITMDDSTAGFAFYPGTNKSYEGDVFFNVDVSAEENNLTVAHELGHALGLKHPFEGSNKLETSLDNINHSIMSYTHSNNYTPELYFNDSKIGMKFVSVEPEFYSLYDVAALQSIYGVNETTNNQDNTYSTTFLEYKIQTIWDTGGVDTIDLSTTTGSNIIDLSGGSLNSVDKQSLDDIIKINQDIAEKNNVFQHNQWISDEITDLYNMDDLYMGADNFAIANGVVIENILTGSGADIVMDNEVDNQIFTFAGDDKIYIGDGGFDYIDAGDGYDSLYLDLLSEDVDWSSSNDGSCTLYTSSFMANIKNIEVINFKNTTTLFEDLLI